MRVSVSPWLGASLLLLGPMALLLVAAGCSGQPRNFLNDNDRLRAENLELRDRARRLEEALALREAQVAQMTPHGASPRGATAAPGGTGPATAPAAGLAGADVPRLVGLKLDDRSGLVPHAGATQPREHVLRLYVRTLDQQGRFLPVAGAASAQAVVIRPGQPPLVLGEASLGPKALDRAYRSGMTGTHYTIEIPLSAPPEGIASVAVRLSLTDAATGATVAADRAFALNARP